PAGREGAGGEGGVLELALGAVDDAEDRVVVEPMRRSVDMDDAPRREIVRDAAVSFVDAEPGPASVTCDVVAVPFARVVRRVSSTSACAAAATSMADARANVLYMRYSILAPQSSRTTPWRAAPSIRRQIGEDA